MRLSASEQVCIINDVQINLMDKIGSFHDYKVVEYFVDFFHILP